MTFAMGRVIPFVFLMMAAPAVAQESTNNVATMTDWSVFTEDDPKECWGVSSPRESKATRDGAAVTARRGDVLYFVVKMPDSMDASQLESAMDIAAQTADDMELKISGDRDDL